MLCFTCSTCLSCCRAALVLRCGFTSQRRMNHEVVGYRRMCATRLAVNQPSVSRAETCVDSPLRPLPPPSSRLLVARNPLCGLNSCQHSVPGRWSLVSGQRPQDGSGDQGHQSRRAAADCVCQLARLLGWPARHVRRGALCNASSACVYGWGEGYFGGWTATNRFCCLWPTVADCPHRPTELVK